MRMLTDCPCAESTPVTYACMLAAETATSCPAALSCASAHCTESAFTALPDFLAFTLMRSSPVFAPATAGTGANANTNVLAVVFTSCAR